MALINWFPGHIAKARRELSERLKLCDLVLELVDARIPASTQLESRLLGGKPRIVVVTKADLAAPRATRMWLDRLATDGPAIALDARSGKGLSELKRSMAGIAAQVQQRMAARGRLPRPARTMVLGAPNVGKSSLINRLAGRKAANVADKAGVTRAPQWIRLGKELELLDTPGLVPPKLEDQTAALRLALLGSIPPEAFDPREVAAAGIEELAMLAPSALGRYENARDLRAVAIAIGCLLPGGRPDETRAAQAFLSDLRAGRLGALTLEWPPEL